MNGSQDKTMSAWNVGEVTRPPQVELMNEIRQLFGFFPCTYLLLGRAHSVTALSQVDVCLPG